MTKEDFKSFMDEQVSEIKKYLHQSGFDHNEYNYYVLKWIDHHATQFRNEWIKNRKN